MKLLISIFLFLFSFLNFSVGQNQIESLLDEIEMAYQNIHAYTDKGSIKTFYHYKDQEFVEEKIYEISHDIKGNFSFTYTDSYADEAKPYFISYSKSAHQTLGLYKAKVMDQEGEIEQSLNDFVIGMSGISKRIVNLSTSLANSHSLDQKHLNELRSYDKINLLEEKVIRGEACYVLELQKSKLWDKGELLKQQDYNSEITLKNEKELQSITRKSDTLITYFVRKSDNLIVGQERETFFDNGNYVFTRYFMNPKVLQ